MSDIKEVKRWTLKIDYDFQYADGVPAEIMVATKGPYLDERERIEVMPVTEHESIVAELKAEVEALKKHKATYEADCKRIEYFDELHEKVARQARVIEKLREQREGFIKDNADQRWERGHDRRPDDTIKETIEACDADIAAIERAEGEKE